MEVLEVALNKELVLILCCFPFSCIILHLQFISIRACAGDI